MNTHTDDWKVMNEEEKYAEWSTYVTGVDANVQGTLLSDYSDYCDWMDAWEAKNA